MSRFSVVPNKETCAVWTISPENVRGTIVEMDSAKSVRVVRSAVKSKIALGQGGKTRFEFMEHFRNIPVVVSLDSRYAYTSILPFKLGLEGDPRADRLEFHGILRELVNKANLEIRPLAARSLGVEELDSVLFDARVVNMRIDGKEVAGWPQFSGAKLEGSLHLMFTIRSVFQEMQDLLHSRKEIFVTEENKAALMMLEKIEKGPHRIIFGDPGRTEFFSLDSRHDPVFRKASTEWRSPLILVQEEWDLSESSGREVLDLAGRRGVSSTVEKVIGKAVASSKESFNKILSKSKWKDVVYFRGSDVLPFDLPYIYEGVDLRPYPAKEIWDALGFEGDMREDLEPVLLPLLEFFYHRGDPDHHRALARQIHWIAP